MLNYDKIKYLLGLLAREIEAMQPETNTDILISLEVSNLAPGSPFVEELATNPSVAMKEGVYTDMVCHKTRFTRNYDIKGDFDLRTQLTIKTRK